MNKYFKDSWYYLKRAGEMGRKGITEALSPIERTVRSSLGREREPAPTRSERVEMKLKSLPETGERRAKAALDRARKRVNAYRNDRTA